MSQEHECCQTCRRPLIQYKRRITLGMKQFLMNLYNLNKNNPDQVYWHFREIITKKSGGLDYALLESFGLIERKSKERSNSISNGFWRIVKHGNDFVNGESSVPKYIYIYLGEVVSSSTEKVLISQIVKDRFSLDETIIEEEKENG